MTFEELWAKVQGLPDTAMVQVPGTLKDDTKRRLSRKSPEEIAEVVQQAVDEINHGSAEPLDTLIKQSITRQRAVLDTSADFDFYDEDG